MDDKHQAAHPELDEALDGDLELEPPEGEQVKGGYMSMCGYCGHSHRQTDPKCNPRCLHGTAVSTSGQPALY
jgi:hypothetical protein